MAGEAVRGYVGAQNASAFHKVWVGGDPAKSNSVFIPYDGKQSREQLRELEKIGKKHGLPDVVDTGKGVTMTRFKYAPDPLSFARGGLFSDIRAVLADADPVRVRVESGYVPFDKWGDGAATTEMLSYVNASPEIRAALDKSPRIAHAALNQLKWMRSLQADSGLQAKPSRTPVV